MNTHNARRRASAARLAGRAPRDARARAVAGTKMRPSGAALRPEEGLEVEAFAHGALCVCYSGQCFMSSMIGGRSANRGLCAQACRLPYELRNRAQRKELPSPGEHLLSPAGSLRHRPRARARWQPAPPRSRYEGRMKSARVRLRRDRPPTVQFSTACLPRMRWTRRRRMAPMRATGDERRSLEEAFSRGFTTAYLDRPSAATTS